jgi:hypothetical protein
MSSIARDIRDAMKTCLANEAGVEYNELKYLDNIGKNSFTQGKDERYGVRPLQTDPNDTASVNKALTYTQTFEIVLTKGYCIDGVSDTDKYEAFLDLHEIALRFNNKVKTTRLGLARVLNSIEISIAEPVFLDQDKVAVLTGNINIIYRLTF